MKAVVFIVQMPLAATLTAFLGRTLPLFHFDSSAYEDKSVPITDKFPTLLEFFTLKIIGFTERSRVPLSCLSSSTLDLRYLDVVRIGSQRQGIIALSKHVPFAFHGQQSFFRPVRHKSLQYIN